jgi:hypothetical protein
MATNTALRLPETLDVGIVEEMSKRSVREGEEGLLLAMLEMATEDFQKYVLAKDSQGKELFRDAEEWILSKGTRWFFSFENVCRHLQLDPAYIRRGLMNWKAAILKAEANQTSENGNTPATPE